MTLCGQSDWALPDHHQLSSIIDLDTSIGKPRVDPGFFPKTKAGDYWTSDSAAPLSGVYRRHGYGAKAINFGSGDTTHLPYRNAAFVRLVSASFHTEHSPSFRLSQYSTVVTDER
ncbi:DUF1566 domain-containing protein [Veronia pacifica]|uniref:Lcl C-terminal domain-containing protein n=2 Tax=Veronia pacifica TaxID=1080227 RepID=A0A1C3EL53_9GAMM|nr:DUF1566 domain-containing protein [Veronia pacifica]ODA33962.1 hypothetical protein A8L45_07895 [Veronia pacifica]